MGREPEPIKTAGLFPPSLIVERFANYFPPGTPFSYILLRLHEISEIHPRFHLCGLKEQLTIADAIHTVKGLSIQDRIMITSAPCNMRNVGEKTFLRTLAECIAEGRTGHLLELPNLPLDVMDEPARGDRDYLFSLEQLHKMVVLYLWLSYRFPNVFTTRPLAVYTKKLLEDQIEDTLQRFSHTEIRKAQKEKRERARLEREKEAGESIRAIEPPATDDLNEYPEEPVEEAEKASELDPIPEEGQAEQRRSANL
jgi:ATP-dependent RNA helicase SUPV3L1/SUV3